MRIPCKFQRPAHSCSKLLAKCFDACRSHDPHHLLIPLALTTDSRSFLSASNIACTLSGLCSIFFTSTLPEPSLIRATHPSQLSRHFWKLRIDLLPASSVASRRRCQRALSLHWRSSLQTTKSTARLTQVSGSLLTRTWLPIHLLMRIQDIQHHQE